MLVLILAVVLLVVAVALHERWRRTGQPAVARSRRPGYLERRPDGSVRARWGGRGL